MLCPPALRKQIEEAIHEIQHTLLISNVVADRVTYPCFHSQPCIPEALISFKEKIAKYRQQSSDYINQIDNLPLPQNLPYHSVHLKKGHLLMNLLAVWL